MNAENTRIGIIGLGSMSSAIVKGFITYGGINPSRITASARNRARLEINCAALGIHPGTTAEVVKNSDIVIVGVIPTQVENVLREVRDLLPGKIIVSIAYGISHQRYTELLPEGCHVICVVPNTPIEVGKGVLVCSKDHSLTEEQLEIFSALFGSIALIELLPPELLDLGGIVAGSTPAFMDIVIESLADAAVLHGMPRATAYRLVEKMRGTPWTPASWEMYIIRRRGLSLTGKLRCDMKSIPGSPALRWTACSPPKTTRKADTPDFSETVFIGKE